MLIDTHTHLFAPEFDEDRELVVKRALDAGVKFMLLPNIDKDSVESMMKLNAQFPDVCLPMIGLHPCSVGDDPVAETEEMLRLFEEGKFCAIGETGLDLYWDKTRLKEQQKAFDIQLQFAISKNLPIVIHTRDSFYEAYEMVESYRGQGLTGVFHCFSGTMKEAEMVMKLEGFYMGIGGVVTFKNSGLGEVVKNIPLDYLVLETDSPYLAPVPYRGKRNESSYITGVAEKVADVMGISYEEVIKATGKNAVKLFSLKGSDEV